MVAYINVLGVSYNLGCDLDWSKNFPGFEDFKMVDDKYSDPPSCYVAGLVSKTS